MSRANQHSTGRQALAVSCLCALLAGATHARPPLLPGTAFVESNPCMVDPFGDADVAQRERQLSTRCASAERLQFSADGLRVQPAVTSSYMPFKFGFDQLVTQPVTRFFTTNFRLGWTGSSQEGQSGLQTERAMVAAGGLLRLDDNLRVDMNFGRDVGMGLLRTRTTMSGIWRPMGERMMFSTTLADEALGTASIFGLRWWLVPKRVAFDFLARRAPDGQLVEPRMGLSVFDLGW